MKVKNLFRHSQQKKFEILVTPHLQSLYARAYRLTMSAHNAEDLVQELLTVQYAKNHDLSDLKDIRSWLMRGLYNLFVDQWRKQQKSPLNYTGDSDSPRSTLRKE
jgi:RNA polymerase sigma-70 factor, ECF subfamily